MSVGRIYPSLTPKGADRSQFIGRRPDLYEPLMKNFEPESLFDAQGRPTPMAEKKCADWREKLARLVGQSEE